MYSYEERMRAVRLFLKCDKSRMAVINELGYPSRVQLMNWYREYMFFAIKIFRNSRFDFFGFHDLAKGAVSLPF